MHLYNHVIPHLAKLPLAEFLFEDETLARQFRHRGGVCPGTRGGQSGNGIGIVAADALQADDVCLGIMRNTGRQRRGHRGRQRGVRRGARVRGRLLVNRRENLLHVHVQATGWRYRTKMISLTQEEIEACD